MGMAGPFHPPFSFCTAAKRERAVVGPREKTPRRVGPHICVPPAAGGGWLAVPCRSQGRKRPALGEPFGPGKSGIHPAPLFAAAGRLLMKALARGKATASASAGQRVAKRNARKEKLVKCVLAPRRGRHHPPRDGSTDLAEDLSVPEGKAKSALAPIRRPPSRAEGHCTGARPSAFFSSTGRGAFSFWRNQKENGGRTPRGNGPLREQISPGRQVAAPTVPAGPTGRPDNPAIRRSGPQWPRDFQILAD